MARSDEKLPAYAVEDPLFQDALLAALMIYQAPVLAIAPR
jgi:hypothetical protein